MNPSADLPENFYFNGGAQETIITAVSAAILALAIILIVFLPRKYVVYPLILATLLIPASEVIVMVGFHFTPFRVLILAGLVGRALRERLSSGRRVFPPVNLLDKVFLAWAVCDAMTYVLLWGPGAVANRLGFLYSTLGTYFLFRYLIRDRDDIIRVTKALAVAGIIVAIGMAVEHRTGINQFYLRIAGTLKYSEVREGRIRAQGPFEHSIIAGTFGAILLPLSISLWKARDTRLYSVMGMAAAAIITIFSASSTPIMTLLAGVTGFLFWPLRRHMRVVRWSIVMLLILVQLSMNSPIWWIFARLSGIMGGSGWHRAELIDQFVRRFTEWGLIGTRNDANWGADTWDCINAYVRAGTDGGLLTCILFISIIVVAYKMVGRTRRLVSGRPREENLVWALGVALFANTVAYFGIIYFDQSIVVWYALLAMISAASTFAVAQRKPAPQKIEGFPSPTSESSADVSAASVY